MKCQKCNAKFVAKDRRYCDKCANSMTLEQKIQAQRDHKAKLAQRHQEIMNQFNQEVA